MKLKKFLNRKGKEQKRFLHKNQTTNIILNILKDYFYLYPVKMFIVIIYQIL